MNLTVSNLEKATQIARKRDAEIAAILGGNGTNGTTPTVKREISEATRRKLRAAKKLYWRNLKAEAKKK